MSAFEVRWAPRVRVRTDCPDVAMAAALEAALRPPADGQEIDPQSAGDPLIDVDLSVCPEHLAGDVDDRRLWVLRRDTRRIFESTDPAAVLDFVVSIVNAEVLEGWTTGEVPALVLHTGAVVCAGLGIVLCGPSGAGKTTLTAQLLQGGATYLSDELVAVRSGESVGLSGSTMHGYPKCLTLKRGSHQVLAALGPRAVIGSQGVGSWQVPVSREVGAVGTGWCPLDVVVFPRFVRGAELAVRPVSRAEACRRLLLNSMNGARLGRTGLRLAAATVAGASCWELEHGDAHAAAAFVGRDLVHRHHNWFEENGVAEVSVLDRPLVRGPGPVFRPEIQMTSIGGEVVLRDPVANLVVVLDGSVGSVLGLIDGGPFEVAVSALAASEVVDREVAADALRAVAGRLYQLGVLVSGVGGDGRVGGGG